MSKMTMAAAAALLAAAGPVLADEPTQSGTVGTAWRTGLFDSPTNVDRVTYALEAGKRYAVGTQINTSLAYTVRVLAPSGAKVCEGTFPSSGFYAAGCEFAAPSSGRYTVELAVAPGWEPDDTEPWRARIMRDCPRSGTTACRAPLGQIVRGWVDFTPDGDKLRLGAEPGRRHVVEWQHQGYHGGTLRVVDGLGNVLAEARTIRGGDPVLLPFTAPNNGGAFFQQFAHAEDGPIPWSVLLRRP